MKTRIRKEQISSGSATAHQVFAADGSGGVVIETPTVSGSIAVREADGTPSVADVTEIIVSNGTLTDNGDGTVIITTGGGSGSSLTVEEVDGTPSVANVTKIIVTNGTLTNNGDGSVTITIGTGGSVTVATDTIWDAKGDIAVGTGSDAAVRLAVGADGSRLEAASGEASGLIWRPVITAKAAKSGTQSIADSSWTTISFDAADTYDTDAIHDPTTNNTRLTCKTAGYYRITGLAQFAIASAGVRHVRITQGSGATIIAQVGGYPGNGTFAVRAEVVAEVYLSVNDYVELGVFQNTGSALNITADCWFCMTRL